MAHLFRPSLRNTPTYSTDYAADRPGLRKLNHNEAPADLPDDIKDEVLRRVKTAAWHRYPDPFHTELRAGLSKYCDHPADGILVTNGGNDAIFRLLLALDPARPVTFCPPSYYLYERVGRFLGLSRRQAPLLLPSFDVDWGAVSIAATDPAGVVLLTSPNNPTGTLVDPDGLADFVGATESLVLLDEAYFEFAGQTVLPMLARHENLLVLRTLSKGWGVAGLRLGYLVGAPSLIAQINKVTIPYSVDALTLAAGAVLLERPDLMHSRVAHVRSEREYLRGRITELEGYTPLESSANYFLVRVDEQRRPTPTQIVSSLVETGLLLRDTSGFPGLADCFRVTVGDRSDSDAVVEGLATRRR
jgi:histidinol-phosphate aminotransferase